MRMRAVKGVSVRMLGGATAPFLQMDIDLVCGHVATVICSGEGVSVPTFEASVRASAVVRICQTCPDEEVAPEAPAAVGVRPAVADPLGALPKKPDGYKL